MGIARQRLQNQCIHASSFERQEDVVQWLVAVQAQDYAGAKWAVGNALSYIIVVDSQIVGTWKRTIRSDDVAVETDLFTRLTKAKQSAVVAAAQKYGAFLKLPVVLV